MQDPYVAVKEEVEQSMAVVVDLHKKWSELSSSNKKSDELDWTSSELLAGLRSIDWDLQDLEDSVSIMEGDRVKFQLEQQDLLDRKQFIEDTRQKVTSLREEVESQSGTASGFSTGKGSKGLPSIVPGTKSKGYGKLEREDPLPPADEDVESATPAPTGASSQGDEILGAEADTDAIPSRSRHRKKKLCLCLLLLLLVIIVIAAFVASGGSTETVKQSVKALATKAQERLQGPGTNSSAHGQHRVMNTAAAPMREHPRRLPLSH